MIGCWEGEVHYCCLKSYGIFYFNNVWWDHIPNANCTGVKGEHCNFVATPGGDVMATQRSQAKESRSLFCSSLPQLAQGQGQGDRICASEFGLHTHL